MSPTQASPSPKSCNKQSDLKRVVDYIKKKNVGILNRRENGEGVECVIKRGLTKSICKNSKNWGILGKKEKLTIIT